MAKAPSRPATRSRISGPTDRLRHARRRPTQPSMMTSSPPKAARRRLIPLSRGSANSTRRQRPSARPDPARQDRGQGSPRRGAAARGMARRGVTAPRVSALARRSALVRLFGWRRPRRLRRDPVRYCPPLPRDRHRDVMGASAEYPRRREKRCRSVCVTCSPLSYRR